MESLPHSLHLALRVHLCGVWPHCRRSVATGSRGWRPRKVRPVAWKPAVPQHLPAQSRCARSFRLCPCPQPRSAPEWVDVLWVLSSEKGPQTGIQKGEKKHVKVMVSVSGPVAGR